MAMKCVVDVTTQARHYPASYLVNGVRQENPETPERIGLLLQGAEAAGMEIIEPRDCGLAPVARVHTPEYLSFLEHAYRRWSYIDGAADEVTPNIHPTNRNGQYPASVVAQAGYHMADASCPITEATWKSALTSAWSAVTAAPIFRDGWGENGLCPLSPTRAPCRP